MISVRKWAEMEGDSLQIDHLGREVDWFRLSYLPPPCRRPPCLPGLTLSHTSLPVTLSCFLWAAFSHRYELLS